MQIRKRRIRAALGMVLTWGAAWFAAGGVVARVPGVLSDLPFPLLLAPFGLATGIVFSAILVVLEDRRQLARTSPRRIAVWGAVIGLLLSWIFPFLRGDWRELLVFGPTLAAASAVAAAASLALARRAERREPGGPGEDAKRELPGRGD